MQSSFSDQLLNHCFAVALLLVLLSNLYAIHLKSTLFNVDMKLVAIQLLLLFCSPLFRDITVLPICSLKSIAPFWRRS
jgi:hypothetical protein